MGRKTHFLGGFYIWQGIIDQQTFLGLALDLLQEQAEDGWIGLDKFDFTGNHDALE